MRKSAIIGTCLANMGIGINAVDAETKVQEIFADEFPGENFLRWNTEVDETLAHEKIRSVGRASRINVRLFILDLW